MNWVSLIVGTLKLLVALVGFFQRKELIRAGEDKIIAQQATKLLTLTRHGRALREKVKALDDEEADRLWDNMLS